MPPGHQPPSCYYSLRKPTATLQESKGDAAGTGPRARAASTLSSSLGRRAHPSRANRGGSTEVAAGMMIVCAFGDGHLPPAPSAPPDTCLRGAEQSAGIEAGLLAMEDGSVESTDSLSTNCVGSKAKQERKPTGRETILAALTLWLAQHSYLPAAPSPGCPSLRPLALLRHAPIPLLLSKRFPSEGLDLEKCSWRAKACLQEPVPARPP